MNQSIKSSVTQLKFKGYLDSWYKTWL